MDCQAPGLRQARAQRQGFAWRVYVHQWSRVTERNCLVCLACLCLASLRQDLAVMPGAGFDFRRRGQCGDVCWDACGLSASGVWTTLGVLHVFQRRCGVSRVADCAPGKCKEPRCCKAYRPFRLSTLHVLYGFVVSSHEIVSKKMVAEKQYLYQCCVTFALYVRNGLVFVEF